MCFCFDCCLTVYITISCTHQFRHMRLDGNGVDMCSLACITFSFRPDEAMFDLTWRKFDFEIKR